MIREFPPVYLADSASGLLAVGGDLEVGSLELAYRSGIFPWPADDYEKILWFAPPQRAVLLFHSFKIPKRLRRDLQKYYFRFSVDTDFAGVIRACAHSQNRKGQRGTWITPDMLRSYNDFHHAGFAHSFETYNENGDLVGGMYGVLIGKYFAGESMFYLESNASKFALIQAVRHLERRGVHWMDIQVMTPLLERFGAVEMPRKQFMHMLEIALAG